MSIQLTEEQQAVVTNRGGELLVSAAAGSGKTRVLVDRLLTRVTEEGLNLDQFLVITYTKAAAAELRGKILDELNRRLAQSPGDRRLQRQTTLIGRAQISTIHSFCTNLLRESGHLLDLDPDFRVGDEGESAVLKNRALDRVLAERYEQVQEGDDFSNLLDTMSAGRDDSRLASMVLDVFNRVQSHPDPRRWLQEQEAALAMEGVSDAGETPWGRLLMDDAKTQTEYWRRMMIRALDWLDQDEKLAGAYSPSLCDTLDSLDNFLSALNRSWDGACRVGDIAFPRLGAARNVEHPALQERVKALRDKCKRRMAKLTERFSQPSARLLEDQLSVRPAVGELFRLVAGFDEAYTREKQRRKLVDFSDLEHLALRLLVDERGEPTPAAERWSEAFAEVMVDEYQDTNEVQNAIFNALTGGGRRLFQVGDVKQSIYRFRLADPTIFLGKYDAFTPHKQAAEGEPRTIVLSRNFRSRAKVLEGVNFLFENLMSRAFGELDYTAEQRLYPGLPYPEHPDDRVELDVVDLSGAASAGDEEKLGRDQAEARFLAKRIRELLDSGFPVTEGDGLRPVNTGDIVILYRSVRTRLPALTRALAEQNIPWQADDGGDFFSATEISVAVGFLQIIDNPRQDIPLISVLRSPVYAFTGDQLARIRAASPTGDFYSALVSYAQEGDEPCRRFLDELNGFRLRAGDLSSHQILWDLYERTGLISLFGALPGGENRQANLRLLYEYARQFEGAGHKGLFGFVSYLRQLEESGRELPSPANGPGQGVKIMSIHKSKGLEFPVVFVAGLSKQFNNQDLNLPMLFHPRLGVGPNGLDTQRLVEYPTLARTAVRRQLEREMKAEELRLLYVAMTRAREKLILVHTTANWASALKKLAPDAVCPAEPEALDALSSVGEWVLLPALVRPEAKALRQDYSLELCFESGPEWDIRLVDGAVFQEMPEAGAEIQGADPERPAAALSRAEIEERLRWRYPSPALADLPSKVTATQLKGRYRDEEAAEESGQRPLRPLAFERPRFALEERGLTPAQKGTALHLAMELIDLRETESEEQVEGEILRLMDQGSLTEQQGEAVDAGAIARFYASELGRQAKAAPDLRREFKFSILTDAAACYPEAGAEEQVLLQGVVDCCFTGPEGLTVVDFKTDHVRPGQEAERAKGYWPQLEVYTRALEEIFKRPVARKALWFFATGTAVEG
ncbi:MAG: helicase-exonuclease AddAB subunit AddA [Oscillospiraceae bacterium]|nr:helicase-exonuclease AddAB subunit AddA [Oscillospiraceae bacterium]